MNNIFPKFLCLALSVLFIYGCKTDSIVKENISELNIRISRDPAKLNPIFNPSSSAREVFQYIYLPLADFHPESLALSPILIEEIPEENSDEQHIIYTIKIKEDAVWSDGMPITGQDYAFTIKSIKLPQSNTGAWRALINNIKDVKIDSENAKQFSIYVDKNYMLALEVCLTIDLLPAHIYDKENALASLQVSDDFMANEESYQQDSTIMRFVEFFNSPQASRDILEGAGPYMLRSWNTNQSIILYKKKNYWGDNYPDNPFLQSGVDKMIFKIMPDDNTAITALKNKEVDVMTLRNSDVFANLKKEENADSDFQFFTPATIRYYYIALNNDRPQLQDKKVRRALAHLLDIDKIISTIDYGLGRRTTGHFNPAKAYYNNELAPIPFDIEKAKTLLSQAGWKDTDDNGILDKVIDGRKEELTLEILISGNALGENVALLFQNNAKEAGVDIKITRKKSSLISKEHTSPRKYDMAALAISQDAAPDDAFPRWHSSMAVPGERNYANYRSAAADKILKQIRETRDEEKRGYLYMRLQEIMYEDQPVIFLYSPKQKIITNNNIEATATAKRPGYLANTFHKKVVTEKVK
jgi:peptide/nickel transport system substrate-binding protein